MNSATRPQQDSEMDLVDLYLSVKRHWAAMSLAFAVVLVAGILFAVTRPVQYNYSVVLELGGNSTDVDGLKTFVSPESVQAQVEEAYLPEITHKLAAKDKMSKVPSFDVSNPRGSGSIIIKTTGDPVMADGIKAILTQVADEVVQKHREIYQRKVAAIQASYQGRITMLEERIRSLEQGVDAKGLDPADKAVMTDQLQALKESKADLAAEMQDAVAGLQPTEIVKPPQRSAKPVGLSAILLTVAAALVGFIVALGVGLVGVLLDHARARH